MPTSVIQPARPNDTSALDALAHALDESLQLATQHHLAGQLDPAETLYRGILEILPQHAQANYGLGRLAVQAGHAAASLPYFAAALKAQPDNPDYQLGCIDALMRAEQFDLAQDMLDSSVQQGLQGDLVDELAKELKTRTQIARTRRDTSALAARAPAARQQSGSKAARGQAQPSERALTRLALSFQKKRHTEAKTLARALIQKYPQHGYAWKTLGATLAVQGDLQAALAPMETATRLLPQDVEAQYNLGRTLAALGREDEAEASLRLALEIEPAAFEVHWALAGLLQMQARLVEAQLHCQRALEIDPSHVDALLLQASVLTRMRRLEQAEEHYEKALVLDPANADGHNSLGMLLLEQNRWAEAEAAFRRTLKVDPERSSAYANLGAVLFSRGRQAEAYASYRQSLQLQPNDSDARSAMLYGLSLGQSLAPETLFAEHRRFGAQFEAPLRAQWTPHARSKDPQRPLQIGFVSGDLYIHSVASFFEPVLSHLAQDSALVLHAYSARRDVEDQMSQRLRRHVRHWHRVGGLDDAELAAKVRADGIDILIDLSGHTARNRLLAFARKPAPLQVSWIGYPGTTGLESMDYYLCNPHTLPPGQFDNQFTEKLVYLPASAPFLPVADAPPVNDLPALAAGHITFGSFNRLNKISREVVALWAQLLRAVPDARMVVGGMSGQENSEIMAQWFDEQGIARERLDFHQRANMSDYLAQHHQVDLCLDTFPYNGGTTSLHALWMGVPTLTLAGSTMAGRAGAGILAQMGLDEFVASDAAAFVAQGVAWSKRLPELAQVRAGLRDRFAQSAIGQPALIATALTAALRTMWQRWCAHLPAESFEAIGAAKERT